MQQMRGMKRPHDVAPTGWPSDAKRPAVAADYPPTATRQLMHFYLWLCFVCVSLFVCQQDCPVRALGL